MQYIENSENILSELPIQQDSGIPEIKLTYVRDRYLSEAKINSPDDAADFFRSIYPKDTIQLQELFYVLYLSQSHKILGYYHHAAGGIASVTADARLILGTALKTTAVSIMVCHNHPSGNLIPSDADKQLTKSLQQASNFMSITLLDHIILTSESYYSFATNHSSGVDGLVNGLYKANPRENFITWLEKELLQSIFYSRTKLEEKALEFGIKDKTEVKEYSELAISKVARMRAREDLSTETIFKNIVSLYQGQAKSSLRTSQSILLQQYSTPVPIGFLAGIFCRVNIEGEYFEPSAGNGFLTIAGKEDFFTVNELDNLRYSNLKTLPFKEVHQRDASKPFIHYNKKFDAVLTNPPFGNLAYAVPYNGIEVKNLDLLMALYALDTIKDDGRAAFIIGGHSIWDEKGRMQAGKNLIFFNYLYKHYHIADVINIDGSLYARQGTSFDVRLILIAGRKSSAEGNAPLKKDTDKTVSSFDELYDRVMTALKKFPITRETAERDRKRKLLSLKAKAVAIELELLKSDSQGELGSPYQPASSSCIVLNTVVPDAMSFETHQVLTSIKEAVGGSVDEFVRDRLMYSSSVELCKSLSAEQTDAVAIAIYNIEAKGQGTIIGDQTGIGKGRIAASIIRYAVNRGLKPIFITEKPNLFSDLYRDLAAIGSGRLVPFILNLRDTKTDIKDEDGKILHKALPASEQEAVVESGKLPQNYDFVLSTYSQFNSPEKRTSKPAFILGLSENNILILDESHNSSGSSNTGEYMQKLVQRAAGVVFLSATFAKRPDNMPVYALKTAISEANMTKENLIIAIGRGGVALQEVLASQLVAEGQMIRRERSFEGVEVNYISLDEYAERDKRIADGVTKIIRQIIRFQSGYITPMVNDMDTEAAESGSLVTMRGGTDAAGVDNMPYFSKVFQVINQMLFSIKAEAVAERAIARLKEGKKPVIAFASTMGSFIETLENEDGLPVGEGNVIRADFSEVLKRGLNGVMRYTITGEDGKKTFDHFDPSELSQQGMDEYLSIFSLIKEYASGITISPIDIVIDRIEKAGYTVAEVTGRKYELKVSTTTGKGTIRTRQKLNTNDAFRMFNNNEVDVLMINQSGSTGASAHAIVTSKIPKEQVKQRVMIILQAELDINTEVQKRGRINRTGQILLPIYDYVVSAIPAEKRLMMMLQKKLKSLDANTTSNQKQSSKILDVPDFLNKYGDKVVKEYLIENKEINLLLGDPLNLLKASKGDAELHTEDAAHRVSGRVAVLSVEMQQKFYDEISIRYNDFTEYLKQVGSYDLEVETMNLQAKQLSSRIVKAGKGGESSFGEDTYLEKLEVNVLRRPFTPEELETQIKEKLQGKSPEEYTTLLLESLSDFTSRRRTRDLESENRYFNELREALPLDKKILAIKEKDGKDAYQNTLIDAAKVLEAKRKEQLSNIEKAHGYRMDQMSRIVKFFYPGRQVDYPMVNLSMDTDFANQYTPSVSLGIVLSTRSENNWLPSQVKIGLAIAGSLKYLALPISRSEEVEEIMQISRAVVQEPDLSSLKTKWEKLISRRSIGKETRYMVTGNLLQAYSEFNGGRLVSYTTDSGEVNKGIFLPDSFEEKQVDKVTVPVSRATAIITSMGYGSQINLSGDIALFRNSDGFKMIVPASKNRGGEYYLDEDILPLTAKGKFESVSGKMVAIITLNNLPKLLEILQKKFNISVRLSAIQYKLIEAQAQITSKMRQWAKLKLWNKPIPSQDKQRKRKLLSLKAKAIELELSLLNFAA